MTHVARFVLPLGVDRKIAVQHRIDGRGVMTPFRATVSVTFENPFRMVDIARSAVGYAQFSVQLRQKRSEGLIARFVGHVRPAEIGGVLVVAHQLADGNSYTAQRLILILK